MKYLTFSRVAFANLCAAAIFLAIAFIAQAESRAGSVELLAFDTDASGNTATSVGDVQICNSLEVGEQLVVDIVIKGVPEVADGAGGLTGFDFGLRYDERYVEITDVEIEDFFMGSAPGSNLIDFTDAPPDSDGIFRLAIADFGTDSDESGDGVLARITFEGVGVGTSDLIFAVPLELRDSEPFDIDAPNVDASTGVYETDLLQNGLITVGVECAPGATAPPRPADLITPTPGPETPVQTNPDGSTPTNGAGPGETDQSPGPDGETADPDATPTPTCAPSDLDCIEDSDDGGGGSSSTIIIIAVAVTALLLALAGAGYIALRRKEDQPS